MLHSRPARRFKMVHLNLDTFKPVGPLGGVKLKFQPLNDQQYGFQFADS